MESALLLGIALLVSVIFLIIFLNKKLARLEQPQQDQAVVEWLKSMQSSLEMTNKTLNQALQTNSHQMVRTLQENSKELNERLDKAAAVIRDVGKEVGHMSEIGRSMKELQDFLKSPKMRGNIGEEILQDLIAQLFPKNNFFLQYQFSTGDRVDAAIKTDAGILPIDAKFPLENFQKMAKAASAEEKVVFEKEFVRDIKKHIDAIAKKYILPQEGTMDFALMYIPSESVFYELCNQAEIMNYARKNRVYAVSPSTLYAHLQTILLSYEGKRIESKSKEVFKLLRSLQIDYEKVNENLLLLGKHLTNATAQMSNVTSGFHQLGNKLQTTNQLEETVVSKLEESSPFSTQ